MRATRIAVVAAVMAATFISGCATHKPAPHAVVPAPVDAGPFAAERYAVLRCPGRVPVALEFGAGAMRIDGASSRQVLRAATSSSGELYEGENVRLWITGESALFEQPGGSPIECRVQAASDAWDSARRRGVTLRATGDGGRWWFEVLPEKWLLLATAGGEERVLMAPRAPEADGDGWKLLADDGRHRLELHAESLTCSDGNGGETLDTQVSIRFDGIHFAGCGRWLAP